MACRAGGEGRRRRTTAMRLMTAVRLAKTDLTTELVKEFTELQGVVGGLYARAQGLGRSAWRRRSMSSTRRLRRRIDFRRRSRGSCWGLRIGSRRLRRCLASGCSRRDRRIRLRCGGQRMAIVKILAESELPLNLSDVAHSALTDDVNEREVLAFLRERLHFYLKDVRGFALRRGECGAGGGCG